MIQRTLKIAYGFKNFQNHMGISDNVTLAGLLKRYTRKYPRTYNFMKKGTLLGGVYLVIMSLIPGTALPLQKEIKLSIFASSRIATKLWFYNIVFPEPEQYLIRLNEIALSVLDSQIYDAKFLGQLFTEIQVLVEEQKKQLKQTSYMDILIYSEIILQNVIRYQKRFLLEKAMLNYYQWVYATIFEKLATVTITQKEQKHIKLIYPLIQYLLNFGEAEDQEKCIHIYNQFAKKLDLSKQGENNFRRMVMSSGLKQTAFKESLKKIYTQTASKDLQRQILQIFEGLNLLYERQRINAVD